MDTHFPAAAPKKVSGVWILVLYGTSSSRILKKVRIKLFCRDKLTFGFTYEKDFWNTLF